MADQLLKERFEPYKGEAFQILLEEGQVIDAVLTKIDSLGKRPYLENMPNDDKQRTEAFTLTFQVPTTAALPQMMYTVKHAAIGETVIFLVPVGMDENGRLYEAVFN